MFLPGRVPLREHSCSLVLLHEPSNVFDRSCTFLYLFQPLSVPAHAYSCPHPCSCPLMFLSTLVPALMCFYLCVLLPTSRRAPSCTHAGSCCPRHVLPARVLAIASSCLHPAKFFRVHTCSCAFLSLSACAFARACSILIGFLPAPGRLLLETLCVPSCLCSCSSVFLPATGFMPARTFLPVRAPALSCSCPQLFLPVDAPALKQACSFPPPHMFLPVPVQVSGCTCSGTRVFLPAPMHVSDRPIVVPAHLCTCRSCSWRSCFCTGVFQFERVPACSCAIPAGALVCCCLLLCDSCWRPRVSLPARVPAQRCSCPIMVLPALMFLPAHPFLSTCILLPAHVFALVCSRPHLFLPDLVPVLHVPARMFVSAWVCSCPLLFLLTCDLPSISRSLQSLPNILGIQSFTVS